MLNHKTVVAVVVAAIATLAVERGIHAVIQTYKIHQLLQSKEKESRRVKEALLLNDYIFRDGTPVRVQVIMETLESIDQELPRYFPNGPFSREDFIAMALLESNFKQFLVGTSGEKGIFQIMPEQYQLRGIKNSHFDVRMNTQLSMEVLRDKYTKHQDYKKAIIAYNGVVVKNGKWSEKYWKAFSKRREAVDSMLESLK